MRDGCSIYNKKVNAAGSEYRINLGGSVRSESATQQYLFTGFPYCKRRASRGSALHLGFFRLTLILRRSPRDLENRRFLYTVLYTTMKSSAIGEDRRGRLRNAQPDSELMPCRMDANSSF